MAIKKYALHAIKLLGASPLTLSQLTQRTVNPKQTVIYNSPSGGFSPAFAGVAAVEPEITFDSTELGRILTACPVLTGLAIASGNTYTAAEVYHEAKVDMGGRGGALTGLKQTTSKAMFVVRSITCEHRGEAKLSGTILALSTDGLTASLVNTDLVTVPAQVVDQKYTLGKVVVNGTQVNSVMGVTIDFGLEIVASGENGETYPKFATINKLEPQVTIRTTDVSLLSTIPETGTNLTSGAIIYFRKFQASSIVYADASVQHISITLPSGQGMIFPQQTSGSGSDDESHELMLRPLAGSSAMLTVNPLTAIA
jgi:hypothetical protein